MTEDAQKLKIACMVCCPMCDEEKCMGRFTCKEIKRYLKKLEEKDERQADNQTLL